MQRNFIECYKQSPKKEPVKDLENKKVITLRKNSSVKGMTVNEYLQKRETTFLNRLPINHSIAKVTFKGTRKAALQRLDEFAGNGLWKYTENRNDPDENATSGLSIWLHYGKISTFEIVEKLFQQQPREWHFDKITYKKGSASGFFNGNRNIENFLDQLITWREVGFHYAYHEPDYDKYETLPDWAFQTLEKHKKDPRKYIYELDELAHSRTHDELWNAAQTELREEGVMNNYMRMLWGKKVIEWTPNPEIALAYLIDLNNRYAVDGRDPNSYSGIFWCFGRFDRAWQERPIYGKVRYMTSESARKKLKLEEYLKKYSP
jgi:deoxyribodipyrimidine photo-lyase